MSCVRYSLDGAVASIRLDRPHRLNAVTPEMVDELVGTLERARSEGARLVLLSGEGRAFCAGWDLKEPPPVETIDEARVRLQRMQDVTRRIVDFPGPVIAALHGYAIGAGIEFALACDVVIASEETVIGFPEVSVGLTSTNGASALLPQALGILRAKELLLLTDRIDAGRAWNLGLVSQLAPVGDHESAARDIAESLLGRSRDALALTKRLINAGAQSTLQQALDFEVDVAVSTIETGLAQAASERFPTR
jgi:enoyl-CoA hydratase/carnithine racemase